MEFLENEAYADDAEHGSGWYTYKIIHLAGKLPGFIRALLPASSLQFREQCWIPDPEWNEKGFFQTTSYICPLFDQLSMTVQTHRVDDDEQYDSTTANVFDLPEDALKKRKIKIINIEEEWDCLPKECNEAEDPTKVGCSKAGRPPLSKGWQQEYRAQGKPLVCVYKLVTVSFKYWGMQGKVEQLMQQKGFMETFYKMHRPMLPWMNEWFGMTKHDIRVYEERTRVFLERLRQNGGVDVDPLEVEDTAEITETADTAEATSSAPIKESAWSITAPQREPLPPDAPISDILEAIVQRQNAMDQQQEQILHHVEVLSRYLEYQQQMLKETHEICLQSVTAAATIQAPGTKPEASQGSSNVLTNIFKFGNKTDSAP